MGLVKDRGGEEVHEKFCVWEVGGEVVRARVNITIKKHELRCLLLF